MTVDDHFRQTSCGPSSDVSSSGAMGMLAVAILRQWNTENKSSEIPLDGVNLHHVRLGGGDVL